MCIPPLCSESSIRETVCRVVRGLQPSIYSKGNIVAGSDGSGSVHFTQPAGDTPSSQRFYQVEHHSDSTSCIQLSSFSTVLWEAEGVFCLSQLNLSFQPTAQMLDDCDSTELLSSMTSYHFRGSEGQEKLEQLASHSLGLLF